MSVLLREYENKKSIIRSRLNDFTKVRGDDVFYELCFCLLTPQTSAKAADKTIQELRKRDFKNSYNFNPVKLLNNVRFNRNKSKYLREAKGKYEIIKNKLNGNKSSEEMRGWLVSNVKGMD